MTSSARTWRRWRIPKEKRSPPCTETDVYRNRNKHTVAQLRPIFRISRDTLLSLSVINIVCCTNDEMMYSLTCIYFSIYEKSISRTDQQIYKQDMLLKQATTIKPTMTSQNILFLYPHFRNKSYKILL